MAEKDPNSPATTSLAYDAMAPRWRKTFTVLGGTEALKAAGPEFLPQHSHEESSAYDDRLHSNVFFNLPKKILGSWVGKPFSSPVAMGEKMPDIVREWGENIDFRGNNFSVFLRRWFTLGTAAAFAPILVEMPNLTIPQDRPRTMADDLAEGVRPYWVLIDPRNVLCAAFDYVGGREVVSHLRVREYVVKQVGFAEQIVERVRVYDTDPGGGPVLVRLFEKRKDPRTKKEEWVVIARWSLGVNFIPLVNFYADQEDAMMGYSPLLDVVDLSIRHWQSSSDQISCLTVARFPLLAASGVLDDDEKLKIGPRKWLYMSDAQGRFYYVEHGGKALEAGRQELLDLEEQMTTYGVEMLRRRPTNVTATGRILDDREATSPLEDMAIRFNDAVNQALHFTALWAKLPTAGELRVNTEFSLGASEQNAFNTLLEARRERDLSREQFLREMRRLGALDDEFDFALNLKELANERDFRPERVALPAEE